MNITEKILNRLLAEAKMPGTEGLAAHVRVGAIFREIFIYDTSKALLMLPKLIKKGASNLDAHRIIRGYTSIKQPSEPCNGAWEVKGSAGPGYGKLVYGVAYAASPTGILMSDRKSVSEPAQAGWKRARDQRISKELDDFEEPKTPDPSDDCEVYKAPGREFLNRSYEVQGWENDVLVQLKRAHQRFCDENKLSYEEQKRFQAALVDGGHDFFSFKL
jgi:hypothetical protein